MYILASGTVFKACLADSRIPGCIQYPFAVHIGIARWHSNTCLGQGKTRQGRAGQNRGGQNRGGQGRGRAPSIVHGISSLRDHNRCRRDSLQGISDDPHAGGVVQRKCVASQRLLQLSLGSSSLHRTPHATLPHLALPATKYAARPCGDVCMHGFGLWFLLWCFYTAFLTHSTRSPPCIRPLPDIETMQKCQLHCLQPKSPQSVQRLQLNSYAWYVTQSQHLHSTMR